MADIKKMLPVADTESKPGSLDVRRIEVNWGGRWIEPKRVEVKSKRTVIAFVESRTGWANVRFHNYRGRDAAWRHAPNDQAEARRRERMTMENEQDSEQPAIPPLPPATGSAATYLAVKCFECGHKDAINAKYYRPRGGEFWCDECGDEREYEPDLSPNARTEPPERKP